jgi:Methylase involved in ubiquinone/menaquinone biosynthesis
MKTGFEFDEEQSRRVEAMYRTSDIVGQQREVLRLLSLRPGERVLDIGSGPGQQTSEMAAAVGASGSVLGIDTSESMIAIARQRCREQRGVDFQLARATELPFKDSAFDAVVCTQVYEYVAEIETALLELYRVLRPGGRALILDTDWDSIIWHTTDRARMRRMLRAWEGHLTDPRLPETLLPTLRKVGFQTIETHLFPLLNTNCSEDTYSYWLIRFVESFVVGKDDITLEDANAWAEELRRLHDSGSYFFSLNRYIFLIWKDAR